VISIISNNPEAAETQYRMPFGVSEQIALQKKWN
jgi:hypothetical protein